jgi:folate-binding protein YgfZ
MSPSSLPPETVTGVQHVRARAGFSPAELFGVLELEGPEAGSFLDAQLPVRVLDLAPGQGAHTAYLDTKGRVTHDVRLLRLEDRFWILARLPDLESLEAKLERYHIREEFTVRDLRNTLAVWEVHGPATPEILGRLSGSRIPPDPYVHLKLTLNRVAARFMVDSWSGDAGGHLIVPRDAADALSALFGHAEVPAVDASVLDVMRIEGGRFERGPDVDDRTLLLELERPEMVSHDKGCYLGQETIARVHARGHVNRRLVGLEIEGDLVPEPGSLVVQDDTPVGETKSACYSPSLGRPIALAMMRIEAADPGGVVHVRLGSGLVAARVRELPLYRPPGPKETAEALYRQGMEAFKQDRFVEAMGLFERAILMNPHHLDAFESMGISQERLGRLDEATQTMEALTQTAPDHVMAWTNLSRYYAQAGRIADAERIKGHVTYLVLKRDAGAKAAERKASEEEGLRRARLEERVALFEQVLSLDPEDVVANFGLGKVLFDLDRWEDAAPYFRKAIEKQESYSMAYNHLGTCLMQLGRTEEARDIFRHGIEAATRRGDLIPRRDMERKLGELGE